MFQKMLLASILLMVSSFAMAVPPDIAAGVDFTWVITQVGTIAIAIAGVYVVVKGARLIFSMLR